MHELRLDVAQDAGVVGNQHDAHVVLIVRTVHALRNDLQCVNVQTGVGLIQDAELGLEQLQLKDLVALLLTTGEALVHVTCDEVGVNLQVLHGFLNVLGPGTQGGSLAVHSGLSGTQEVGHGHTGDLNRVLHSQEQACACTLVHAHLGDVLTVEQNLTGVNLVLGVASNGGSQSGLTGTVRAHDCVNLARVDGQVNALQDGLGGFVVEDNRDVKVLDFKSRH